MSDEKRDARQRKEMDKWLGQLDPGLRMVLESHYKAMEIGEENAASRAEEAKLDAAQDALIKNAKALAEAKRKAAASGPLPAPMSADCKIVRGKVPGPPQHALCKTHGHVLDVKSRMVIAYNVDDYKKRAKAKTLGVTTLDFSDQPEEIEVPVTEVLPGRSGEQEIEAEFNKFQILIGDYWSNYEAGISKFTNSMNFASEQEAEAKHLNAVFTAVAKKALDIALDEIGTKLGGHWGKVIGIAKEAATAWAAESERAAAAAGEVNVKKYINGLIEGVGEQRKKMRDAIEQQRKPWLEEFQRVAKQDYHKGKVTPDRRVIGEAAGIIQSIKAAVAAFEAKIPARSYFQQEFSRAFADTPGRTDYVSHGGREAGKLYFKVHVVLEKEDGQESYSIDSDGTSPAWKLVTLQEHPERVAASLLESLGNAKPWQIDLEKKVEITIEIEEFGLNDYKEGWIVFTKNPNQYEVRGWANLDLVERVWKTFPKVRDRVLNTTKLVGSKE